ncbi:MAG: hypothetical protein M1820_010824 [Bogoriella megaspora]|nr:MAG: hypothetical protein M1820_010824 [Bogoriella megaspora]
MCGRYVLFQRPSEVRRQLQEEHMPSEEAPEDDEVRQTYNFAPGYNGLVYRADVPDYGAGKGRRDGGTQGGEDSLLEQEDAVENEALHQAAAAVEDKMLTEEEQLNNLTADAERHAKSTTYKLQAMKWGLVPFWTKRNPGYGSTMKTINCRDDSLIENRGMWNTMKQRKRCIVVCEGFYEWLKKNGGKEKIPHFVKRKDGSEEKLYTYSIITTNSNKQLQFLHDRMPVILDNGSEAIRTWLDPGRAEWSRELQSLLKPYQGELECYPVSKDVGKVGNNSASFVIPIDSSENKSNIANFFGSPKKAAKTQDARDDAQHREHTARSDGTEVKHEPEDEHRATVNADGGDSNAPVPVPVGQGDATGSSAFKREHSNNSNKDGDTAASKRRVPNKSPRLEDHSSKEEAQAGQQDASQQESVDDGSTKRGPGNSPRKARSATSNPIAKGNSPAKDATGSQKITSFFSMTKNYENDAGDAGEMRRKPE